MLKVIAALIFTALIAVGLYAASDWTWDLALLELWIHEHALLGACAYVGVFVASTLLPVTSLPLLPLAARTFGVPLTFVMSTLGWWIGCLLAFEVGRRGRPFLQRLMSQKMLTRCEALLAKKHSFSTIVILRMLFPGDFVGLAVGLLHSVGFPTFAAAAFVGTLPSALVASYAGGEFGRGRYWTAVVSIVALVVATLIIRRVWENRAGASQTR